jgi:hypothetical protein
MIRSGDGLSLLQGMHRCTASMAKHLVAAIVLACISAVAPAMALAPGDLAGWWLAVDGNESPRELLIVAADGAVEYRVIQFQQISVPDCAQSKQCSDTPLIARGRMTAAADKLEFAGREAGAPDGPLTATLSWPIAASAGNRVMTLGAGSTARTLVRIEPDRLRRLRAGLMTASLPADKHWRCFVANATAADAAFAPLRKGKYAAPAFLNDYLRIASYRSSLAALGALPTADDPDADRRKLAGLPFEVLMAERFKDVDVPRTAADARRYRAQANFIEQRSRAVSPQQANVVAMATNGGTPVTVAATGAEYSALMRVVTRDPEAKRLFCVE